MAKDFPLSITVKAIDKATAPLRAINKSISQATAPIRSMANHIKALSDEAGIPRLARGFRNVGSAVRSVGAGVAKLGLTIGAMAAAAGYGLFRIIKGSVTAGDDLATIAQRVGLTVDAYAQLQYAAAQADVEQESFNRSMDVFTKQVGEAQAGTGTLLAFLQKVAPEVALQVKGSKSTEEALGLLTRVLERVPDPSRRAALAAAAFGRSGLQMGQFLGQGSKAVDAARAEYLRLAGSQEAFAAGSGELDNALRRTATAAEGAKHAMVTALFPALSEMSVVLANLISENRGSLIQWAKDVGAALSSWVKEGGPSALIAGLKDLSVAVIGVAQILGKVAGPAATAAVGTAALAGSEPAVQIAAQQFEADQAERRRASENSPYHRLTRALGFNDVPFSQQEALAALEPIPSGPAGAATAGPKGAVSETRVVVDFNNLPPGARVRQQSSGDASVDLSLGYSMAVP